MIAHEKLMVKHMMVAHMVQLTFGENNLNHCAPFPFCIRTDMSRSLAVLWAPNGLQILSSHNEVDDE